MIRLGDCKSYCDYFPTSYDVLFFAFLFLYFLGFTWDMEIETFLSFPYDDLEGFYLLASLDDFFNWSFLFEWLFNKFGSFDE